MAPERSSSDRTLSGDNSPKDEQDSREEQPKKNDQDQEEKQDEGPPLPVGFWDKKLKKVRFEVIKGWAITTLILMAFIIAILSLYWAVLFRVPQNMKSLTIAVVDFDARSAPYNDVTAIIGPAIVQAARQQTMKPVGALGYVIRDASEYNYDPIAVRQSIYDEHDWAAIIINNNATALLQQAVTQGNQTYDPLGAAQIVYIQARDETTYGNYIIPQLNEFQINIEAQFGERWVRQVLSNSQLDAATYSQAPQAINPAIGFSIFNLRPFEPQTATPAITIGLIYLIIISFFSFSFYLPIHSKFLMPQGHPPMHFWQMTLWRLCATLVAYSLLSLAYSLVSLAFQIPFSNTFPHNDVTMANNPDAYGKASFVIYWIINFLGMLALGLASENVSMIVGQPWTALWLIFWVITNVSTSFYSLVLSPGFFTWGYAWPLYHVVMASRTVLFDIHSRIGLNIGVLCAWGAINVALFFPCCIFMRWKSNKETARKVPRSTIRYLVDG